MLLLTRQFYAKLSKCHFGMCSVDYLGHIITGQGAQADSIIQAILLFFGQSYSIIQAILEWPVTTSLTALHALLSPTSWR